MLPNNARSEHFELQCIFNTVLLYILTSVWSAPSVWVLRTPKAGQKPNIKNSFKVKLVYFWGSLVFEVILPQTKVE